jgi:nucleoid-associated protein YgaU
VATRIYVVGRGETVYDIARKELGRVSRWRDIVELNGEQLGGDVDAVSPGMKLRLPDDGRSDVARQRGELLWR